MLLDFKNKIDEITAIVSMGGTIYFENLIISGYKTVQNKTYFIAQDHHYHDCLVDIDGNLYYNNYIKPWKDDYERNNN